MVYRRARVWQQNPSVNQQRGIIMTMKQVQVLFWRVIAIVALFLAMSALFESDEPMDTGYRQVPFNHDLAPVMNADYTVL